MKKIYYLLLLGVLGANAQKLNRVTVEELQEKRYPADTSAAAAILFKKADLSFEVGPDGYWNVVTETKVKIKIYKKEGYKIADVEQAYYTGTHADNLRFSDAATFNLVDGKVVRTKIQGESEFTEKTTKDYKTKKLAFSNVKEGSIIEYSVRHSTYSTVLFRDFYFQYGIPAKYVEYRVATPEFFTYNRYVGGYLSPKANMERLVDVAGRYNQERVTYTLTDVPAMREEDYVNNIDNYRSKIMYELSSKKVNGMIENLATDWATVSKKIYEEEDFGPQLRKDSYFEEDLNALLAGVTDKEQKMIKIFEYVQSRMTWNETRSFLCDRGVRTAYKEKSGNVADINLMLTAMLRYAGLDANPVLVSTRANGIAMFASRTAFNYVIASVEIAGRTTLLDATNKYSQPNVLPIHVLNWNGRLIRKDGTSVSTDLMPQKHSRETVTIMADITNDGRVKGKVRDNYSDYYALRFREKYLGISPQSYIESVEKRYKGLSMSDYEIRDERDLAKPVTEAYAFDHDNVVEVVGDRMYFSPLLFLAQNENPFKQEKREYPIDFIFPYQDKFNININLPPGFAVESLPAPGTYAAEANIGTFRYQISSNGKAIQVSISTDLNSSIVGAEHYETLKMFFKEMISKQNEKIVLKKV